MGLSVSGSHWHHEGVNTAVSHKKPELASFQGTTYSVSLLSVVARYRAGRDPDGHTYQICSTRFALGNEPIHHLGAFFHSRLSPRVELGSVWPPIGVHPLNPFSVPLLNTIILVTSGVSVTWSHHALILGLHDEAHNSLLVTVVLGVYFSILQAIEYTEASFSISDSVYGSTFYVATGFHGLHVVVGTVFLLATLVRL